MAVTRPTFRPGPLRGFSLIELIVAVSILTIISSIVLTNHARFNSSVLLGSLAYDIALSVREAQVYGLSVREFAGEFQVGYGVHFATNDLFLFFTDTNANRLFDDDDVLINTYTLSRGHAIVRFCGVTSEGVERCSDSGTPINHLDVVFFRPNPDALISSNENQGGPNYYSRGFVIVSAPSGETRTVSVASTGQISVQNP